MLPYTLRVATPDDQKFLERLYVATRGGEFGLSEWPEAVFRSFCRQQFAAQTLHYRSSYPRAVWSVVEVAGEAAGRLILHETASHLRLVDISLLPVFRGAGLGTELLGYVIRKSEECRKPASLCVSVFNPAQRLYARLGFRVVEQDSANLHLERALQMARPENQISDFNRSNVAQADFSYH